MDPGGSELDSSLPQPENPCLIVEDSQPDSVALEDDPESSYRALLARRLSSLQPAARSPVLELIASPIGSRSSQTDSQSESSQSNSQAGPGALVAADPSSAFQEESQVINICPPPNKRQSAKEETEMDSRADSTTHCVQSEGGTSQFGFLELSQSQDLRADSVNRQEEEDVVLQSDSERSSKSADHHLSSRTSESQEHRAVRSEVSSSCSLDSQPERKLSIQVLLHSQGLQDQQDCEILSSQQDLFDADKTGAAVDSTVSEPEQQGHPTPTPANTLRVLHLSGQGTLVQESLSQSSVDFVAPTPDHFARTPLIVPSSPTEAEHSAGELMDTSTPPEGRVSKPCPTASTPVSQNSPGFVLERTLSLPSQPEFSHDVFVPTQSQETPQQSDKKAESQSQCVDSAALSLQLSVNTQNSLGQLTSDQPEDDSQATQIEELTEPPSVDTSDAVMSRCDQKVDRNRVSSETQTDSRSKTSTSSECLKHPSEQPDPSDAHRHSLNTHSSCSQKKLESSGVTVNSCVQDTPSDSAPCSLTCQTPVDVKKTSVPPRGRGNSPSHSEESQRSTAVSNSQTVKGMMEEEESTVGGASGMALVLSQSQLVSPEPMEEEDDDNSIIIVTDSDRDCHTKHSKTNSSQPIRGRVSAPTNRHTNKLPSDRLSQPERAGPEPDGLKDRSLSDSSGEISFHFTLPKEGELIGPVVGATPPLITQLKQTLRHSTPIEISSFSEKSGVSADVSADVVMAASNIVSGDSREDVGERGEGKLSLRMKLVTPVEEGSSERFSLQKPALCEDEGSMKASSVPQAANSPSVFSRVRQVHRQQDAEEESHAAGNSTPVRGELFSSPQRSSQISLLECNSLPNSQSEQPSQQEVFAAPQQCSKDPPGPAEPPEAPQTPTPTRAKLPQTSENSNNSSPSNKLRQRMASQQTSFDSAGLRSPAGRGEPVSPSFRRTTGPAHRRHVRTIQEVRTTVTRIITDVYYEDGKEVERKVSEESEEPVVDCQVLDSDISPCRTGSSSVTSGDLGDISSLSSKASSLQHSSGGTSSGSGFIRSDFILPPSRGGRSTRGGGVSSLQRLGALGQPLSSEDEPFTRMLPPRLPVSPLDPSSSRSDSLRSSPEEAFSAGSSFVGLRVVAKWSSNGYFYSGRIMKDAGDAKFRLRFDDGYECEVAGKDILLCDPIPVETEVTALLEDQYFSVGVVKGHKTEGQDLLYSVERDGQRQWYSRTSIILSLDQGNKLREQHSLGPYEPSTPLTKASDISLDNLVEGKRRRRGAPGGENTPQRSSSSSPRTPGPSGKRKLMTSEEGRTPSKRGRRGGGARAG